MCYQFPEFKENYKQSNKKYTETIFKLLNIVEEWAMFADTCL